MRQRAKVFMNKGSQMVRIPREFRFHAGEVFIRSVGDEVVLSQRPADWSRLLETEMVASNWFALSVDKLNDETWGRR
jgi:virulence-associated protein VagC